MKGLSLNSPFKQYKETSFGIIDLPSDYWNERLLRHFIHENFELEVKWFLKNTSSQDTYIFETNEKRKKKKNET